MNELEEALAIDPDDLDSALLSQPVLYYNVSKKVAEAVDARDFAKSNVGKVRARAAKHIRELHDVTNPEVAERIELSKDVIAAEADLREKQLELHKWQGLEKSYDQRASALKSLVQLYLKNYWSDSGLSVATGSMKDHDAAIARREMAKERKTRK